jgi:2-polyprenyl-6-methoxyphenol hydroxylase-like FAD-dependent oxidoreductase
MGSTARAVRGIAGNTDGGGGDRSLVVIVGAGPVGMVLALDLARYGVRSVLIERDTGPLWYPKGNTHNARTMEHYRRLGLADQVRAVGLPAHHPTDVAYFTTLAGHELHRLPMPSTAEKLPAAHVVTDQVPEPLHRANQMYVERVLFDTVRLTPEISCLFGWEYTGHRDTGDGVAVRITPAEPGPERTVHGAFLVGCDGPRSLVRRALGISYQGEDAREQGFMSGLTRSSYLRIPELLTRVVRRPAWQYWTLRPGAVSNFIALDAGHEFLFHAVQGLASDDEAVRRLVVECVGEPVEVEVLDSREWIAGRALVAEHYGAGRVLLCGDAVHLFTPTGGFGMNTGIDDAANLAWKLAASVRGWAGPRLVHSYETERRPIGVRNTRAALNLARGLQGIPLGPILDAESAEGEQARRTAAGVLTGFREEFASLGIQLGARYDDSPLVVGDGTHAPPDQPACYVPTATPGGRAPHLWLPDGRSLFDAFGTGFTLLRLAGGHGGELARAAALRGVPLRIVDVAGPAGRDLYGSDLALIRPDQHVAWRGNTVPVDPDALLDAVTGGAD